MERNELNDLIFEKMDRRIRKRKLYLDPDFSLEQAAKLAGANRTYASRAVGSRFENFKQYINTLRVENLLCDFYGDECDEYLFDDTDEFAQEYGFHTKRSLDRIVSLQTGTTYARIKRSRDKVEGKQRHKQPPRKKALKDDKGELTIIKGLARKNLPD